MVGKRTQAILLPGGVLPAQLAYPALVDALGPEVDARYKELEMYATPEPPSGDILKREVEGLRAFADAAGFDEFHLVGYSAGGASSLAFCTTYPERLSSLTLNEPGWIGSQGRSPVETEFMQGVERIISLPADKRMAEFIRIQLAPGVQPPPPPEGPPPPWMPQRLAAMPFFLETSRTAQIDHDALRRFPRPVLYTLGGRSAPVYRAMAQRLSAVFQDFTLEEFTDRHHFDPPHRAEPARMAKVLRAFWERKPPASSGRIP